jgi:hypothetical protein
VNEDWSLDLAMAPEGATGRIAANINKRGKRAFGVLKTANEYVGVVRANEFEVWEKQTRAIHARGKILPRQRGSHLEVQFIVPRVTRVLLGVFFVLYVLVALGIATQPPDPSISPEEVAVAAGGAVVLIGIFLASARSQRADLRSLLERIFEDVAKI